VVYILLFGTITERVVLGYRKFQSEVSTNQYIIPFYSQFVLIANNEPQNQLGFSNLSEICIEKKIMWDKNMTYRFNWKKGLLI